VPNPIKATFSFLGGVAAAPDAEFNAAADLGGTAARPDLRAGVDVGAGAVADAGDFAVATGAWPLAEALFFSAALVRLRERDDGTTVTSTPMLWGPRALYIGALAR